MATILIVDDLPAHRKFLVTVLSYRGHRLLEASDGGEGLVVARAEHPDLVITDVLMPVMDGYEFLRQLRIDPSTSGIPVMFYTAHYGEREARDLALSKGVSYVLTKPPEAEEVLRSVGSALSGISETGMPSVIPPLTTEFDREHLRLLTDKLSEKAADLRAANARLRALINIGLEFASGRDADRRLQSLCESVCDVFGVTYTTLGILDRDGRTVRLFFSSGADAADWIEIGDTVPGILGKVVAQRRTLRGENPGGHPVGLQLPVLHPEVHAFVAAPIASEEKVYGWICLVGNEEKTFAWEDEQLVQALAGQVGRIYELEDEIIERKQAESALRDERDQRNQALEGLHAAEKKYQLAHKMEAIGRLASGVAHDFNNLLTVILGFAELMAADAAMGNGHRKDVAEIIKAAGRAAGLTRQLLAFSRQQVLRATPIDVNALITEMTGMLGRLIGADIDVSLALAPDLHLALADRGQLEQVVMNLVVNARDAMPGGGSLTIETTDVELENSSFHDEVMMDGRYVMLAITDTGDGMTQETQQRLFEPFYTTKETGKGTGLGLSTTYGIVKQSKGYIWVYSELGRGTTFKVYLPCANGDVPAQASSLVVTALEKSGSETVLLVEDEGGVRQLSKRILVKAGYRVLESANGDDAEKLFLEHADSIDLVVTDVIMPGCGGPELLGRLRVRAPATKVLYMSGYTDQSAMNVGIDRDLPFVQKPFTAAELVRQVRETLDRGAVVRASALPLA